MDKLIISVFYDIDNFCKELKEYLMPKPELYVIYTGDQKNIPDTNIFIKGIF